MTRRWLWVGLLGLTACAGLHRVVEADVTRAQQRWPDATREQLEQGRTMYVRRCAGCHALHRPERYAPEEWPRWVEEMTDDAKLTAEERVAIERYLVLASEQTRDAGRR